MQSIFYDTLPSVVTFSSFFIFSAYLCAKPLSSYGRIWDILAPVAFVGFVGIIALAAGNMDFGALNPVGAAGIEKITQGAAFTNYWFFDSAILLTLLGKIEYKRGMAWKGPLFYLLGAAAVMLFLAVFYGIFSEIAVPSCQKLVGVRLMTHVPYYLVRRGPEYPVDSHGKLHRSKV